MRRAATLEALGERGPFADRYKFNPYALAFLLKYAMAILKASGRLSDAELHALAEAAAMIIDNVFAAEFGEAALSNPNAVHFPGFGI